MHQDTAYDTVQKYHRAWTSGDMDTAMSYVADDITARAPGLNLEGRAAYRGFIGGFAPMLTGVGDLTEFTDADRVALFYYPQTAATRTAAAAELFTVKDAKIVASVLIFDWLSYGPPEQA